MTVQTSPSARTGLHGHPMSGGLAPTVVAEFLGTLVLVLAICATAVPAALHLPIAGAPSVPRPSRWPVASPWWRWWPRSATSRARTPTRR